MALYMLMLLSYEFGVLQFEWFQLWEGYTEKDGTDLSPQSVSVDMLFSSDYEIWSCGKRLCILGYYAFPCLEADTSKNNKHQVDVLSIANCVHDNCRWIWAETSLPGFALDDKLCRCAELC